MEVKLEKRGKGGWRVKTNERYDMKEESMGDRERKQDKKKKR